MLLEAGAWLATTPGAASTRFLTPFTAKPAEALEAAIDRIERDPCRNSSTLSCPGGTLSASLAHMARTVCRRTERRVIDLVEHEDGDSGSTDTMKHILVFSQIGFPIFFSLFARFCNHIQGQAGCALERIAEACPVFTQAWWTGIGWPHGILRTAPWTDRRMSPLFPASF